MIAIILFSLAFLIIPHKANAQNSMSPAEFDITQYLNKGENRLAVEGYRWSDGSYLECQDMWRLK